MDFAHVGSLVSEFLSCVHGLRPSLPRVPGAAAITRMVPCRCKGRLSGPSGSGIFVVGFLCRRRFWNRRKPGCPQVLDFEGLSGRGHPSGRCRGSSHSLVLRVEREPTRVMGGTSSPVCCCRECLGAPGRSRERIRVHALLLCEKPRPPAWGAGLGESCGSFPCVNHGVCASD